MSQGWREDDRLAALRGYGILDTPPDVAFDDFVQIAAMVCEAPIAVVNLIDESRQWFAAELGLGVRETPLDVSICAHAILQQDVFVVPDLTLDGRFDCNPLVVGEPRLRFYCGALLQSPEGLPLGTVCVLDYAPRPAGLTERQRFTLQALARQVMARLELGRAVAEKELLLREAHHRVKNSLQMVQSLLTLQARASSHPEAAQQLRESAIRVRSFGAMHEQLYDVGAALRVDLAVYLGSVLARQGSAQASMLDGREIVLKAEPVLWPSSDAVAIGLVAVELVTNALKYGAGTVTVTLRRLGEDVTMLVADAGNDLPADYDPAASSGLGMRVINGLLQPRRGRLRVDRSVGHTCFEVVLRAPAPA